MALPKKRLFVAFAEVRNRHEEDGNQNFGSLLGKFNVRGRFWYAAMCHSVRNYSPSDMHRYAKFVYGTFASKKRVSYRTSRRLKTL